VLGLLKQAVLFRAVEEGVAIMAAAAAAVVMVAAMAMQTVDVARLILEEPVARGEAVSARTHNDRLRRWCVALFFLRERFRLM